MRYINYGRNDFISYDNRRKTLHNKLMGLMWKEKISIEQYEKNCKRLDSTPNKDLIYFKVVY